MAGRDGGRRERGDKEKERGRRCGSDGRLPSRMLTWTSADLVRRPTW